MFPPGDTVKFFCPVCGQRISASKLDAGKEVFCPSCRSTFAIPKASESMRTVRIFISSPGDVADERDRARQVIESLRRRYAGYFALKALLWEDLPLQPDMSFQEGIDHVIEMEEGVDIAVFILWSRLGSPLGAVIRKPDGSPYSSGTEREFDLMMAVRAQSGGVKPDILVYTRDDDSSFHERLRGMRTHESNELLSQKLLVEKFIAERFKDSETGTNVGAYHTFDRPVTFTQRLRSHLVTLLDRLAGDSLVENVWDVEAKGSPFMGLEAFQPSHASVFFGREEQTLEARLALREQARDGCAFLLLSGASGSGKSSLARAGILPAIVENEVDEHVAAWRTMLITPSELAPDPLGTFVQRLVSNDVIPELRTSDAVVKEIALGLKGATELTIQLFLKPVFQSLAKAQGGAVRVLVVLDQLEELFTSTMIASEDRASFLEALERLARSGYVWVLATARADFHSLLQAEPALVRMKSGRGQMDILPPDADGLRRLVEEPARLAGLKFEERDRVSLASVILRDAVAHAELLPLVEYVLRELYEQRTAEGLLTFAAYTDLGGVEGALARRAEQVFSSLPSSAQAELDGVFQALVGIGQNDQKSAAGEVTLVRQRVPMTVFASNADAASLVGAFVSERLFRADSNPQTGEASVMVAHEALLRAWGRAADWAARNREFLLVRSRVAQRMQDGSPLLEGDPLLDAAKDLLLKDASGFSAEQQTFVNDCLQRVEDDKKQRERSRRRAVVVQAALVAVALIAVVVALTRPRHGAPVEPPSPDDGAQMVRIEEEALRKASKADEGAARSLRKTGIINDEVRKEDKLTAQAVAGQSTERGKRQTLIDEAREATAQERYVLAQEKLKEATGLLNEVPRGSREHAEAKSDILVEQSRAHKDLSEVEFTAANSLIEVRKLAANWPDSWRLELAVLRLENNAQLGKPGDREPLRALAARVQPLVARSQHAFEAIYAFYIASKNAWQTGFQTKPADYDGLRAAVAGLHTNLEAAAGLTETELEILVKVVGRDVAFVLEKAQEKHYADTTEVRRALVMEFDETLRLLEKRLPRSSILLAAQEELGRLQEIGLREGFHTLSEEDMKRAAEHRQRMNLLLGTGAGVAETMATALGNYSINGATEKAVSELQRSMEDFRKLGVEDMTTVLLDYRVSDPLERVSHAAATDSMRVLQQQIAGAYTDAFYAGSIDDRGKNLLGFAKIMQRQIQDWIDARNYPPLLEIWDRGMNGLQLASFTAGDCDSLMLALQGCCVALLKSARADDAKKGILQAQSLADKICILRPWDWYLRNSYMGFCFSVAQALVEEQAITEAQPLLRKAWTLSGEFWGAPVELDGYKELPLKGQMPANCPPSGVALFGCYSKSGPSAGRAGKMHRFTIPCTDATGKEYPFFVYILSGKNGFKGYQDQVRWLKEYRRLTVKPQVDDSFQRLASIARDNRVDFAGLCVYALASKAVDKKD